MLPHVRVNEMVHVSAASKLREVGATRCHIRFRMTVGMGPHNLYHGLPVANPTEEPAQCLYCVTTRRSV